MPATCLWRMLTGPGTVIFVKGQEEGCMLLILSEKARFETKDATGNTSSNSIQPPTCLVSDQLNVPHYRRPWLSTTNIWRMNSTNMTRDAKVTSITQTFVTLNSRNRDKMCFTCTLTVEILFTEYIFQTSSWTHDSVNVSHIAFDVASLEVHEIISL